MVPKHKQLQLASGHVYEGQIRKERPHGLGAVFSKRGNLQSCGLWHEGRWIAAVPVPLRMLPAGATYFPTAARSTDLLLSDASFFSFRQDGAAEASREQQLESYLKHVAEHLLALDEQARLSDAVPVAQLHGHV